LIGIGNENNSAGDFILAQSSPALEFVAYQARCSVESAGAEQEEVRKILESSQNQN
jgi:BioD-like phosphotransacetylase family protein